MKRVVQAGAVGAVVLGLGSYASAGPVYNFVQISNNAGVNIGSQLSVEVLADGDANDTGNNVGVNQVGFLFKNNVGTASNVAEIYFDDGSLLGISTVVNSSGVTFVGGSASPGNLPGGNSINPNFSASAGFVADIGNGDGLNQASDSVLIVFNLINAKTVADTISALTLGLTDGGNSEALRIGMHIRSIGANSQSDAYINNGHVVPLPTAAWMGMSLLGGTGLFGFLRNRRASAE